MAIVQDAAIQVAGGDRPREMFAVLSAQELRLSTLGPTGPGQREMDPWNSRAR